MNPLKAGADEPAEAAPSSPKALGPYPLGVRPPAPHQSFARWIRHDRPLLGAFAIGALLIGFQVGVTLAHPAWRGPVTDWLRAALSWPELFVMLLVSRRLIRAHHPMALSWSMGAAAFLSYAIARNLWTLAGQLIYRNTGVPFPTFPDTFFVLQYPFFLLFVTLIPPTRRVWGSHLIMILDGLLFMGAATILSWYFVLAPVYIASGLSPLARLVSLSYPVGDLFLLFGLTMILLRPSRYHSDRRVMGMLILAITCLIVADSWVARLLLNPGHYYRTGDPPDIFWNAFYLLVPLTGLLQLRLARHEPVVNDDGAAEQPDTQRLSWQDFSASLRLFLPFVAAVLVSAIILVHASLGVEGDGRRSLIAALTLSITLLLLVIVRQEVMFLENARLQRATEEAQANALALREVNRRMEHFLGIVSHELRTPLAVLQGYIQLLARRFGAWRPEEDGVDELARTVARARTALEQSDESVHRLTRLVDDLLDDTQIRDGRLAFHLETFDLGVIVRRAVEEQRMLAADRTILLEPAAPQPMFVSADAARIGQVVTNYLTNALKYSRKDRPIAVRVEEEGDVARVSVRDEGAGVPVAEQERVWARYSRVDGTEVQAGSGVGLGLGLYISKSIIEGHHGQVGVRSAPGRGATFWFTLPLVRRAA